jgi:hypothetical protein
LDSKLSGLGGGNSALDSFLNRKWYDHSKTKNKTFKNDKEYPVEISVTSSRANAKNGCNLRIGVRPSNNFGSSWTGSGSVVAEWDYNSDWSKGCSGSVTVPAGWFYRVYVDSNTWNRQINIYKILK